MWRNFGLPQATISGGAADEHVGWPLCLSFSKAQWALQVKVLDPTSGGMKYVSDEHQFSGSLVWTEGITPVAIISMFKEIQSHHLDRKILPIILPRGRPLYGKDDEPYEHPGEAEIAGKQCKAAHKLVPKAALVTELQKSLHRIPYLMLYKSFSVSPDTFEEDWINVFKGHGAYLRVMEGQKNKTDVWYDLDGTLMSSPPDGDDPNQEKDSVPDPKLLDQIWW